MRKVILMMLSIGLIVMLAACSGNKVDDATAEKYLPKAEHVVTLINEEKHEEIFAMFDENMKTALPLDELPGVSEAAKEAGTFKEISKSSIEEKDGYYITVIIAKHSDKKRIYTVTFNGQEEIAGLFIQ